MTKKRFLSIILTVLMVLSIVPVTPAYANQLETAPSVGVVQRSIPTGEILSQRTRWDQEKVSL